MISFQSFGIDKQASLSAKCRAFARFRKEIGDQLPLRIVERDEIPIGMATTLFMGKYTAVNSLKEGGEYITIVS